MASSVGSRGSLLQTYQALNTKEIVVGFDLSRVANQMLYSRVCNSQNAQLLV